MAKATTPEQHQMLHQYWPDDCCLCMHETRVKVLEQENERLKADSLNVITLCGEYCEERNQAREALERICWGKSITVKSCGCPTCIQVEQYLDSLQKEGQAQQPTHECVSAYCDWSGGLIDAVRDTESYKCPRCRFAVRLVDSQQEKPELTLEVVDEGIRRIKQVGKDSLYCGYKPAPEERPTLSEVEVLRGILKRYFPEQGSLRPWWANDLEADILKEFQLK